MVSVALLLCAFLCFVLAFFGVSPGGWSMIPLGLALWVASILIGQLRSWPNKP